MANQITVAAFTYTVDGIEKARKNSTFEDILITDKEYTDEQAVFAYNASCNCRYEATSATLTEIKYITINPLSNEITNIEIEKI